MENIPRYGLRKAKITSHASNFAEYRMMSLLSGFILAVLFANPLLILWAVLFFAIGLMAEGLGQKMMFAGLICSVVLAVSALFNPFEFGVLSNIIMAGIMSALAIDGVKREKLLKMKE